MSSNFDYAITLCETEFDKVFGDKFPRILMMVSYRISYLKSHWLEELSSIHLKCYVNGESSKGS